jgi:hypothetical protein
MNSLLVQLSKNELSILLSALNYLSTREEKQLHHEYGSILRLYNKLEKNYDDVVKTENCACNPTTEKTDG